MDSKWKADRDRIIKLGRFFGSLIDLTYILKYSGIPEKLNIKTILK